MTDQMIPAEAVEAALRALLPDTEPEALKGGFWWGNVETILEAAAPYMMGRAFEEGYGLGYSDCVWSKGHEPRARNPYMKDSK